MMYFVRHRGEEKPLCDFYDGECFEDSYEDGDSLFMAVGNTEQEGNQRSVYNFYTGEVAMWNDSIVKQTVIVDIEGLGE